MDPDPHSGVGAGGVGKILSIKASSIALRLSLPRCRHAVPLKSPATNQVNFLRNHDGTEGEDELLGNAFLLGMDVANMKRQHRKVFLPAYWLTPKKGT